MSSRAYLGSAAVLTAAGELEVLLGSGGADGHLVTALALPAVTLPVALGRRAPLTGLATITAALAVQAALGGDLVGSSVTVLLALAVALYAAGRHLTRPWALTGAAALGAALAATRIAADPAVQHPRDALLTCVAVATPVVVGRWARGQTQLQRALAERAALRARERARDVRRAAEAERARIAADLQVAVASGLRTILAEVAVVRRELRTADRAGARERLDGIARAARGALADVRRVLGVLRHAEAPAPAPQPDRAIAVPPLRGAGPAMLSPRRVSRVDPDVPPRSDRADWLLAGGVLMFAAVDLLLARPATTGAFAMLTCVPIAAPLLWRRRRPIVAAGGVLGAIALQSALLDLAAFPTGDMLAMVCASFAIGADAERRAAVAGLGVMAAAAAAHAAAFYPDGMLAAPLGGVALPWAVGQVVRGNRRLTLEGRRRNEELERARAQEARAAVTTERLRVARELHDAVAHSISVIAIQAGGAEGVLDRDPARAERSAALIEEITRDALGELASLEPSGTNGDGAGAAPSLARVEQLAARTRAAGVAVAVQVDGSTAELPAGVDLAAYRIVQEALTNTTKHARADHAWVTVRCGRRAVELEIADDGRGPDGRRSRRRGSGGHGLVGMRERVALYGGSLDAGARPAGGYLVRARLPIDLA